MFVGVILSIRALREQYRELREKPFWKLLAADNAPEILALLQSVFFDGDRSIKLSLLQARFEKLLNELTVETRSKEAVSAVINDLRRRGFLTSRFELGADEPSYELSAQAYEALRFVGSQTQSRVAPTEGRLELLTHAVSKLNDDTNEDVRARITRLREEKKKLDERINLLLQGKISPVSELEVKSQFADIVDMLDALDGDFLRVSDRFHELSDEFAERMMKNTGSPEDLLAGFFESYDAISDSDEGKTFQAFYRFLTDERELAELDANIDALKERPFWQNLPERGRQRLIYMRMNLMDRARDTQAVLKRLSGHLRRLVQSREYLRNRRLASLLDECKALAQDLSKNGCVKGLDPILSVYESSIEMHQPVRCRLDDPDNTVKDVILERAPEIEIDLKELAVRLNDSEINFTLLKDQLRQMLEDEGTVTIGDLLRRFPATQGLASAVGYMALAQRSAMEGLDENGCPLKEKAYWHNRFGQSVEAQIPVYYFSMISLKKLGIDI